MSEQQWIMPEDHIERQPYAKRPKLNRECYFDFKRSLMDPKYDWLRQPDGIAISKNGFMVTRTWWKRPKGSLNDWPLK